MRNIPTWMIVMVGLVFNISAALVTHFFIEKKSEALSQLSVKSSNNSSEIGLLWAQIEAVEQKRDTWLLLIQEGEIKTSVAPIFASILSSHLHQKITIKELNHLALLNDKIDKFQQDIREQIDQRFLTNLEFTEQEGEYTKSISSLRNWSIFLQMIGLSLILARDLSRRD